MSLPLMDTFITITLLALFKDDASLKCSYRLTLELFLLHFRVVNVCICMSASFSAKTHFVRCC